MAGYDIRITHRAEKDIRKLTPKLRRKLYEILTEIIANYGDRKMILCGNAIKYLP